MFNSIIILSTLFILYLMPCAFADNSNKALGQVQFSAYGSTNKGERGLFTTDFIVPLYYTSDKNTLLFYNPKNTYSTPEADEFHQGLGLRHIFDDSFILGINAFFDRRQAVSDAWFSQAGVGLEYLSHPLDIRLNWYKPTTRAKTVDATYGFGSSSLIQYNHREEPLQGLDFEAGVPVFDKYTKTRLYLGGYFYQSRLAKDVNGFRARTETGITRWLSMDTTFNSNIGKKEEFYGGLRVNLAFDLSNLLGKNGKTFFSTPSIPDSNNTYLEDRLFERVVRDIDIQSSSSTSQSNAHDMIYVDNKNVGTQDGTREHPYVAIQNGVNAASGGKWVFVEGQGDVQYASNITLTNSVVLWGSGYNGGFKGLSASGVYPVINGGTNGVTLANNNTVMGLKIQNASSDGIVFTNGTTLMGTIDHNIITGVGSEGIGLSSNTSSMSDFVITNNTITNSGDNGIDLSSNTGAMTGFVINNNTFSSNGNDGMTFAFNGLGNTGATISNLTISNNTTDNNTASGIDLSYNSGTISHVSITGNTSQNNSGDALSITNNGDADVGVLSDFNISNNNFSDNSGEGINAGTNGSGASSATITDFTISNNMLNNDTSGIDFSFNGQSSGNGTISNVLISNNTVNNSTSSGIHFDSNGNGGTGTLSGITVKNNTVNSSGDSGINFSYNAYNGSGTMSDITVSNNTTNSNGTSGIDFSYNAHNNTGSISNVTISNNISNNNTNDGVDLSYNGDDGAGNGTLSHFTISNNTLNNNGNAGLDMTKNGYQGNIGTIEHFTISHNTINSNGNDGIDMTYNGYQGTGTISDVTISNNTVNSNTNDGFELSHNGDTGNGTMTGFTISNNTFNSNYIGLDLRNNGISGSGTINDFTLTSNTINNSQFDGVVLSFNYDTISNWTFLRNTVVASQYFGIIFSRDVGGSYANINLGNGTSGGYNSLYGNGSGDLSTQVGFVNLPAEYNWWGQAGGPIDGQVNANGGDPVDFSYPLRSNPN